MSTNTSPRLGKLQKSASLSNNVSSPPSSSYNSPTSGLPAWTPNKEAARCPLCETQFTVTRRRHHCRQCGRVICDECSRRRKLIPSVNATEKVRVCDQCDQESTFAEFEETHIQQIEQQQKTIEKLKDDLNSATSQLYKIQEEQSVLHQKLFEFDDGFTSLPIPSSARSPSFRETASMKIDRMRSHRDDLEKELAEQKVLMHSRTEELDRLREELQCRDNLQLEKEKVLSDLQQQVTQLQVSLNESQSANEYQSQRILHLEQLLAQSSSSGRKSSLKKVQWAPSPKDKSRKEPVGLLEPLLLRNEDGEEEVEDSESKQEKCCLCTVM